MSIQSRIQWPLASIAACLLTASAFVVGLGYSWQWVRDLKPRYDPYSRVVAKGAISQIRTIFDAVRDQSSLVLVQTNAGPVGLEGTLNAVASGMAPFYADFFKLLTGTNHVWVALNPHLPLWHTATATNLELAAYWPLSLSINGDAARLFVGIRFDRRIVYLVRPPTWTPVPIAELLAKAVPGSRRAD